MWTVLLAAVLVVCVASSADARRRHHGYYGYNERYSRSSLDEWRARQSQGQSNQQSPDQNRDQGRDDRGQDRAQSSTQSDGAQSRGQDAAPDRWQDRRDRYDRRRARSLDDWRRMRESGDWQRSREDSRRARYDEWRRAREDDRRRYYRDREDVSRTRDAQRGEAALSRGRSGPFGAAIEKLVRGCAAQGAEFENWPFDSISRTVGPDETQGKALDGLREAAKQAAQKLAADCPQDVPAAPAARLEAAEQGIDAALKAYDIVEPKLAAFYAALNDEQKARLLRDMAAPAPPAAAAAAAETGRREAREEGREAQEARRERYSRRHRWRDYAAAREAAARERQGAPRQAAAPGFGGTCEQLAAVLRNWPVREIERDVRLSGPQRIAFYELVTASLRAADTLGSACSAEAALTPVGRMEGMRKRLSAVRAATAAIRPALARFYEALDQGQKVRFAGMS
jgi:LTXXQ motif family protein